MRILIKILIVVIIGVATNKMGYSIVPITTILTESIEQTKTIEMNSEVEIWKDINGYEGIYRVSSYGRVKRLIGKNSLTEKNMSLCVGTSGYAIVILSKNGVKSTKQVHVLVSIAFVPNPYKKKTVNHKDGIKTNNYASNLEWNTQSENNKHAYDNGLRTAPSLNKFGILHHRSKQVNQIDLSGNIVFKFGSIMEAVRITGISQSCISKCINNKRETAGGHKWEYSSSQI